jgi:hypothetical protein
MLAITRLLVCVGALVLTVYALFFTQSGSVVQRGADLLALPTYRAELREELDFGQRLDEKSAALMVSEQIKQEILEELIHGRLKLIETAKRFRDLDRVRLHGRPNKYCLVWPGSSEIERYCNQIIHAVRFELHEQPSMAEAVIGRLNCEFQAAAQSGTFCLLR